MTSIGSLTLWWAEALGIFFGLAVALGLSCCSVGRLLEWIENKTVQQWGGVIPRPLVIDPDTWNGIWKRHQKGGGYLGPLEVIIFFASFWFDGWPLLASWLAFKVASQWESWRYSGGIRKFVEDNSKRPEDLLAVQRWIGLRYSIFLVGTAANIVVALVGTGVGRVLVKLVGPGLRLTV